MKELTSLYGVSKTLRFELKPIGKTLEHIEKNGLIAEDEIRATKYKQAKEVINRYHKQFIDEALEGVEINLDDLKDYEQLLENEDELDDIQTKLRKSIVRAFSKHPKWKTLFKKELITKELPRFLEEEISKDESDEEKQKRREEQEIISHFKKFTTYFSGFHENRKHMYSDEAKHSTIAYRIVHENLPVFFSNIKLFNKINNDYKDIVNQTQESVSQDNGILGGAVVEDMFKLDYFTKTLSQTHIDLYNAMIGGITKENGDKIQGFNEKINLYRQQHGLTKRELPNLKPLYKQILSDRASLSWLPGAFEDEGEVVEAIDQFYNDTIKAFKCCDGEVNLLSAFFDLFKETENYDKNFIYIKNDVALTDLSQATFKYYNHIKEALWEHKLSSNARLAKSKNLEKKRGEFFKTSKLFSFAQIESAVDEIDLFAYYQDKTSESIDKIENAYDIWNSDKEDTAKTKDLLDTLLNLYRLFKGLKIDDAEKDLAFYSYFDTYVDALSAIQALYNKVRNFKTKKPYSQEKFKFTIDKSNLLNGFVESKTDKSYNGTQYGGYLFRKKRNDGRYNYYLGISSKANLFSFYGEELSSEDVCGFERLHYYQVKTNSIYGSSYDGDFSQDKETLLENEVIEKLQNVLKIKYQHVKSLREVGNRSYVSLKSLQDDIEIAVQKKSFIYKSVSKCEMEHVLSDGSMLLFQIYNKDFSEKKKNKNSRDNLHTMYFKALMRENSDNDVFDIGKGEIFFRRKSINYDDYIWENGHHHKDLRDNFEYPIIKDRRYAVDKFLLHLSIFLNYKQPDKVDINSKVNNFIKQSNNIKIIGIDRGERHLLYLSLIDAKGNIIEQYSLNQIVNSYNGKEFYIDYHEKLTEKEIKRDEERKSWKSIENIKELKEGYLSQVIHKIATLILEHQAIVVLEDLNFGFKRGRFKVEKQVYQKFEKMLIDKLNYLVDKKREWSDSAGVLKALQLTNKFKSFEKLGKQSGILFYVPAWKTSKMDPATGFVNLFNTKYQSVEKSKEFFSQFRSIRYNGQKGYYEFEFDYNDFGDRAQGAKSHWTVCSYGKRIVNFRNKEKNNQWECKKVDPTQELKELFGSAKGDLKEFIVSQDKKDFFVKLLRVFAHILQMRNSATGTDIDYLLSPVADEKGNFFDSRKSDGSLPLNADANGAYNIARKGLMLVEKIKSADDKSKAKLTITNKEWMAYAQGV